MGGAAGKKAVYTVQDDKTIKTAPDTLKVTGSSTNQAQTVVASQSPLGDQGAKEVRPREEDLNDRMDDLLNLSRISGTQCEPCENTLSYSRIQITDPPDVSYGLEAGNAAKLLLDCLAIRAKYVGPSVGERIEPRTVRYVDKSEEKFKVACLLQTLGGDNGLVAGQNSHKVIAWDPFAGTPPALDPSLAVRRSGGVYFAARSASSEPLDPRAVMTSEEFCKDYVTVLKAMNDRGCGSFCAPRLHELELRFELHSHRNGERESAVQKSHTYGRDWHQVRKVDTHIHHSACFSQRQLMSFIRRKMLEEMDTPVAKEGGRVLTLREIFSTAGVADAEAVNLDSLCCLASVGGGGAGKHDTFGRFDVFNSKYNPFGDKRLREVFLKTDNYIEGRFLAELTKNVMEAYHASKFVYAEWRISIYGRSTEEWAKLAKWFRRYNIQCQQVRWLIQVPRLYAVFKKTGAVRSFADMLRNIFEPLFQASIDPASHEDMFFMLQQVVGFDSVDDESQGSHSTLKTYPSPEDWTAAENPPFSYWMFYMYANIRSLNALRRSRGLNTFAFRPHCGEAGNVSHLCSGFMLAESICHGVQLANSPVLQYLYYLAQVGLAVSPLSNDILFVPLHESPFGQLFRRGLNVSLSTDDPLIIHLTEEALIEEYVTAARTFRLSLVDLCEIARNSVHQSGFESLYKDWWVGSAVPGAAGNDEAKSNVPSLRLRFRADCLREQLNTVAAAAREASST